MNAPLRLLIGLALSLLAGLLLVFIFWYRGKFLPFGITTRLTLKAMDAAQQMSPPAISADGRIIAYEDEVVINQHTLTGVFVLDRQTGQSRAVTEIVECPDDICGYFAPALSANGCVLAFVSLSLDDTLDDMVEQIDVYVDDCEKDELELASVGLHGALANDQSIHPKISTDGRYVAFESLASNLIPGDTNHMADIFVRDRLRSENRRVSVSTDGSQANGASRSPGISANGRYIVFYSSADNLTEGISANTVGLYLYDMIRRETNWIAEVYRNPNGLEDDPGGFGPPSVSADGRYVLFSAMVSEEYAVGSKSSWPEGFIHDRQTGETVSIAELIGLFDGQWTKPIVSRPMISGNGRIIVFFTEDGTLVPGDTNDMGDVFTFDIQKKQIKRVSVASDGTQGNLPSYPVGISENGRHVLFRSTARNLTNGDINGVADFFIHDSLDYRFYLIPFLWRQNNLPAEIQPYPYPIQELPPNAPPNSYPYSYP